MVEVNTSVTEGQEGESLLARKQGEPGKPELSPKTVPETPRPPQSSIPASPRGETRVPPEVLPTTQQAQTKWPVVMEESLNDSSITEEHRTLLGGVLQSIRSIDNGLKEAFNDLLKRFKASSSASASNVVEMADMNRNLKISDDEIDHHNK
ncbi:hypothetical protein D1007_53299 [Hordeum vulgare]|nr:hypothetical protein D1007_53299 [Hordeum vulgare]